MSGSDTQKRARAIPTLQASGSAMLIFVAGVLVLSWLRLLPRLTDLPAFLADGVLLFLASFSPIIIALILVGWFAPGVSLRAWLQNGLRSRVGGGLVALAIAGPPLLAIVAVVALAASGGNAPVMDGQAWLMVIAIFVAACLFALGEEVGWRGYLQAALQSRSSALLSALAVGVVWTVWHAPAFFTEEAAQSDVPAVPYLAMVLGVSVVFAWFYNSTSGSVLLVSLMHGAFNAAVGSVFLNLPEGNESRFIIVMAVLVWATALVLIVRFGAERLAFEGRSADE